MAKHRPDGDGMIRKKGKSWQGRIIVGHDNDNEPIFRYINANTQKELIEKLHRLHIEYEGIELNGDSYLEFSKWIDIWLEKYGKTTLKPSTLNGYKMLLDVYVKRNIGNKIISSITTNDIQKLYTYLKSEGRVNYDAQFGKQLSGTTVSQVHSVLSRIFDDAVKNGLTHKNPTRGTVVPKRNNHEMGILNEDERERFLMVIKKYPIWFELFYLELTTGLRLGELCGLKWSDFDEKSKTLSISRTIKYIEGELYVGETKTKTGKRLIYLPDSTSQTLAERKKESSSMWIFPDFIDHDKPINPRSVYLKMKNLLKEADCPSIRFHDLRHTFATHAISGGVDIKTLSNILGHAKSSFTLDTYTHVTSEMQKKAAEKVDDMLEDMFGLDVMSL